MCIIQNLQTIPLKECGTTQLYSWVRGACQRPTLLLARPLECVNNNHFQIVSSISRAHVWPQHTLRVPSSFGVCPWAFCGSFHVSVLQRTVLLSFVLQEVKQGWVRVEI